MAFLALCISLPFALIHTLVALTLLGGKGGRQHNKVQDQHKPAQKDV